ncbi:F-box DNA helicase 1-like, partial [Notechis scutatus]|uniref:F-box DNA helicase 1-like n=1 Tax=Notechis scutatus TaxID=8663 RepID=A0A6J1VWK4_9SAUR
CASAVRNCYCQDPTAVLMCLKLHSFFPMAEVCIAKRFPDLDDHKEQPTYVRAVMATIVLLAGGVCDVQELVNCLRRPSTTMSRTDSLKMMYCMATLLYAMQENEVQISKRLHYSVFYCLRHLENSPLNDPELSSSERDLGSDLQFTSEQQQILKHAIAPGERVKIMGFAGTGKTSTLIQYARKWSTKKFLYLAFSRSMVDKVSEAKLTNLTCKTIHGFALDEIKENYPHMKDCELGSLTFRAVSLVLSNPKRQSPSIAMGVIQTLKAFFASTDESITKKRVPTWCRTDPGEKQIMKEARKIWSKMKMLRQNRKMAYTVTHDGYLKYLQLRKPSISQYDVIMVDGVEDCTP